jgi:hypothetical protein
MKTQLPQSNPPYLLGIFNMSYQVGGSLAHKIHVFLQVLQRQPFARNYWWTTAMHFESPDGGHNDCTLWFESGSTALDVKELFHANVSPESSFCHDKTIRTDGFEGNLIRNNGTAQVSKCRERLKIPGDHNE